MTTVSSASRGLRAASEAPTPPSRSGVGQAGCEHHGREPRERTCDDRETDDPLVGDQGAERGRLEQQVEADRDGAVGTDRVVAHHLERPGARTAAERIRGVAESVEMECAGEERAERERDARREERRERGREGGRAFPRPRRRSPRRRAGRRAPTERRPRRRATIRPATGSRVSSVTAATSARVSIRPRPCRLSKPSSATVIAELLDAGERERSAGDDQQGLLGDGGPERVDAPQEVAVAPRKRIGGDDPSPTSLLTAIVRPIRRPRRSRRSPPEARFRGRRTPRARWPSRA